MWKTRILTALVGALVLTMSAPISADLITFPGVGPGPADPGQALVMYDGEGGFIVSCGAKPVGTPAQARGIFNWFIEGIGGDLLYDPQAPEMLAARAKMEDLYDQVIRQQHPFGPEWAAGANVSANEFRAGVASLNDPQSTGTQNFANFRTGPLVDPSKLAYTEITTETINELFKFKAEGGNPSGEKYAINSLPGGGMDPITVIPEPGTLAMLLFAGFGLGLWGWRRRK